jgi:hypothetical protein
MTQHEWDRRQRYRAAIDRGEVPNLPDEESARIYAQTRWGPMAEVCEHDGRKMVGEVALLTSPPTGMFPPHGLEPVMGDGETWVEAMTVAEARTAARP